MGGLRQVVPPGDDLAISDNDGTDGDLSQTSRYLRFSQSFFHILIIAHTLHSIQYFYELFKGFCMKISTLIFRQGIDTRPVL